MYNAVVAVDDDDAKIAIGGSIGILFPCRIAVFITLQFSCIDWKDVDIHAIVTATIVQKFDTNPTSAVRLPPIE